jgi:spore maturation protein SpmB
VLSAHDLLALVVADLSGVQVLQAHGCLQYVDHEMDARYTAPILSSPGTVTHISAIEKLAFTGKVCVQWG